MSRGNRRFAVTTVSVNAGPEGNWRITADTRAGTAPAEEPLELRAAGETLVTTMRTPGHDIELAHGWLFTQGLIRNREDVVTARYCAGAAGTGENTYNLLDIALADSNRADLSPGLASAPAKPATGLCGVPVSQYVAETVIGLPGPIAPMTLDPQVVTALPGMLHDARAQKRSGLDIAGVFRADGTPVVVREDVDGHHAADKVVGNLLLADALPANELILATNARASYELVRKAAVAGFAAVVTTAEVSSLAVELAREAGIALAALVSENSLSIYAGEYAADQVRN